MGTLKEIIFQLNLHQRVLNTLILPQCLSTQTIPLSPNIGFWIPLSVFKLSTQYPYYSQFFEYSVKNTLIDHTLIDHNACTWIRRQPESSCQLMFEVWGHFPQLSLDLFVSGLHFGLQAQQLRTIFVLASLQLSIQSFLKKKNSFTIFQTTRHYGALLRASAARSGSEGTLCILCIDPTPKSGVE